MSPRLILAHDVVDAAYDRIRSLYDRGDRVVVSCSGGKDSTVCVELTVQAARDAGRLPVEVVMRDEEIMFPGTFEYCARLAARTDEVDFHWVIAGQPVMNAFDRFNPYFWVFDELVEPDRWVRKPPGFDADTPALPGRQPYRIPTQNIHGLVDLERFTPLWPEQEIERHRRPDGTMRLSGPGSIGARVNQERDLPRVYTLLGLRASESPNRFRGVMMKGGWIKKNPNRYGVWEGTPLYDWRDGDIWRFIHERGIDYNSAYDVMRRMGIPGRRLRIAPPTLVPSATDHLQIAAKAWPRWFDRLADRLGGVRRAAQFGRRAVMPYRRTEESWEQCFKREILDAPQVPDWIKERAVRVRDEALAHHRKHSGQLTLHDGHSCESCYNVPKSWRQLTEWLYAGDPLAMKNPDVLEPIEPEFFRPGAGSWGPGGVAFA